MIIQTASVTCGYTVQVNFILYKERPIVIYEYQKGRNHHKPLDFYRDYNGILVTDSLQQYHLLEKKLPGITNALVYSISETAKLNSLRPYYYFKDILTELPKHCDKQENIDPAELDDLMPWSASLPDECRKPRRCFYFDVCS